MKSKLPIKRLSEIAEIKMGQSPKGSSYNTSGEGVPLINGPVEFGETPFSRTKKTKFTTEPTKICRAGDLIICVRGSTTGRMNIAGYDSCIGRGVASIRSEKYQDWINFFIHANREVIYRLGSGATFPNVSGTMLAKLEIPIPPLPEQKQIVAILDEAFEGIDRAIANTEKNLANARELFESYLNEIFTQKGDGWIEKRLGKVCDVRDGTHDSPKYVTDGIAFITQKNIRENGLTFENIKFITAADHNKFHVRSNVAFGDILISMIGANRGMACIVDDERIFSIKNVGLIKLSKNINRYFLLYFLKSKKAQMYVESASRGGAQPFIGLSKLRDFPISIAPPHLQETVVMKLDELYAKTQRLEAIYRQKIAALNELKQSILQKAFTGELTADFADQKIEAAEENHRISQDCFPSAEAVKQNVHPSEQLSLWA